MIHLHRRRWIVPFPLLYAGGLRVSEAVSVRRKDAREQEPDAAGCPQGQVTVLGKEQKVRSVLIAGDAWAELAGLSNSLTPEERLFAITRQRAWKIVKEAAERAGIDTVARPVSPHWLRHAHCSHAIARGCDLAVVRDTVGHSSIATTSTYIHASPRKSSGSYLAI